jgi:hypothetical protein
MSLATASANCSRSTGLNHDNGSRFQFTLPTSLPDQKHRAAEWAVAVMRRQNPLRIVLESSQDRIIIHQNPVKINPGDSKGTPYGILHFSCIFIFLFCIYLVFLCLWFACLLSGMFWGNCLSPTRLNLGRGNWGVSCGFPGEGSWVDISIPGWLVASGALF